MGQRHAKCGATKRLGPEEIRMGEEGGKSTVLEMHWYNLRREGFETSKGFWQTETSRNGYFQLKVKAVIKAHLGHLFLKSLLGCLHNLFSLIYLTGSVC